MLQVTDIIQNAAVAEYVVAGLEEQSSLYGPRLDPELALKLYVENKTLAWAWTNQGDDPGLWAVANYVQTLAGRYSVVSQAPYKGGQVEVGTAASGPQPVTLIIGAASGSPVVGASSWDLSVLGFSTLGYRVDLYLNKLPVPDINWDGVYFQKNPNSNILYLYGATWKQGDLVMLRFTRA